MLKKINVIQKINIRHKIKSYFFRYTEFVSYFDRPNADFSGVNLFVYFYAIILAFFNVIRVFDNCFWGDELFSINLAHMNFIDLINATANDVHPPLYYIILRISSLVFGFYPSLYHLVSVVPYIIVVLFSISFIRKKIGNWGTLIFISIISLSEQAVKYNVEVRMYSLAATFVLFSFYSLLKIMETGKGYVCFIITALAAAYTHYYALLSVSFFYLAILFYAFSKKEFISILLVCIFSILLYVPWLAHFLSAYQRTSNGFWITAFPSVIDSFFYFFGESKRWYTILMLLITTYTGS